MRGNKLVNIRTMLKGELGYSLEAGVATQADRRLDVLLENKQLLLSSQMDWSFLERQWNTTVAASTQTVAMPINPPFERINTERPMKMEVQFGEYWQPVCYGIDSTEYNVLATPQDPIQQWRFHSDAVLGDVLEVWPIPLTTQTVRITAQRQLRPLKADTDVADLDDLLLVYFVAADLTQEADSKSAAAKALMAKERLRSVTQTDVTRNDPLVFGANLLPKKTHRNVPIVIVSS